MTYSREELAPDLGDVDYASVLAARVARFRAVRSDLGESPEDPAMLMLEQSSYWDVVRTEGFRGAIVGSYLDYATGATLAVLGEQRSGLTRGSDESETGYRARVRRAGGLALALGSEESIKATAYGSDSRVIDVAVVWGVERSGRVGLHPFVGDSERIRSCWHAFDGSACGGADGVVGR